MTSKLTEQKASGEKSKAITTSEDRDRSVMSDPRLSSKGIVQFSSDGSSSPEPTAETNATGRKRKREESISIHAQSANALIDGGMPPSRPLKRRAIPAKTNDVDRQRMHKGSNTISARSIDSTNGAKLPPLRPLDQLYTHSAITAWTKDVDRERKGDQSKSTNAQGPGGLQKRRPSPAKPLKLVVTRQPNADRDSGGHVNTSAAAGNRSISNVRARPSQQPPPTRPLAPPTQPIAPRSQPIPPRPQPIPPRTQHQAAQPRSTESLPKPLDSFAMPSVAQATRVLEAWIRDVCKDNETINIAVRVAVAAIGIHHPEEPTNNTAT